MMTGAEEHPLLIDNWLSPFVTLFMKIVGPPFVSYKAEHEIVGRELILFFRRD